MAVYFDYLEWTQLTAVSRKIADIHNLQGEERKKLFLRRQYGNHIRCFISPFRDCPDDGFIALDEGEVKEVAWSYQNSRLGALCPLEGASRWGIRYDGPKDMENPLFVAVAAVSLNIDPRAHLELCLREVARTEEDALRLKEVVHDCLCKDLFPRDALPKKLRNTLSMLLKVPGRKAVLLG